MKRYLVFLVAAVLASSAWADGAATYAAKCKMCHGANGEGSKIAPDAIAGKPADVVKKTITEGKGKMKPVKIDDVDEVAAYVAALKK